MAKLLVLLANGFEEIEAITIIDVCKRGGIEVTMASIQEEYVIGAHNITIKSDCLLSAINANDFDMVVLPGGWGGTKALAEDTTVQNILKSFKNDDKLIGAICAAPFALKSAGVLNDNYTCYPSVEESIKQDGYHKDDDIVIDSQVITSRGPATAMAFALEIITLLIDEETSVNVAQGLLYNQN